MFITNNHDSFHLWWNENLVKHQKVSKYYDQDCSTDSSNGLTSATVTNLVASSEDPLWSNAILIP